MNIGHVAVLAGTSRHFAEPTIASESLALGKLLSLTSYEVACAGINSGPLGEFLAGFSVAARRATAVVLDTPHEVGQIHPTLMRIVKVASIEMRKFSLFDRATACIVLPGGLGTLDEIIWLLQEESKRMPVILVNVNDYFTPLMRFLESMASTQLVKASRLAALHVAQTSAAAVLALEQQSATRG